MTREEWKRIERDLHDPKIREAMRGRCEEQGHDWESGVDFMPLRVFQICKWCDERR